MGKLTEFLSGGIGSELAKGAVDLVKNFFPAKLSEGDEIRLQQAMVLLTNNHVKEMQQLDQEDTAEFNQRIKDMEGTAQDLKAIPFVGPILIMLRGLQRPVWGLGTLWIDFAWMSGKWTLEGEQTNVMWMINLLVLGFLFGERAIKNLEPLIMRILERK